jgi:hypothetical protein
MPRRISLEERIKRLEENKAFAVEQATKRASALYQARIDLLREKGLKKKKAGPLSLKQRVELGRDRYIFFRTRFYEYMGFSHEEAQRKATEDYENYRAGFLVAFGR